MLNFSVTWLSNLTRKTNVYTAGLGISIVSWKAVHPVLKYLYEKRRKSVSEAASVT